MMMIRAQLEAIRPNSDRLLASDNTGRVAGVILTLRSIVVIFITIVINWIIPLMFLFVLGLVQRIRKTSSLATLRLGTGFLRCAQTQSLSTKIFNGIGFKLDSNT